MILAAFEPDAVSWLEDFSMVKNLKLDSLAELVPPVKRAC